MTILKGEHYTVETIQQFLNRTDFSLRDVIVAVHSDDTIDVDVLESLNTVRADIGEPEIATLSDAHEGEIEEYWSAGADVGTTDAIISVLEADSRDWIHLYDGIVHDIVEVYNVDEEDIL